MIKTMAALAAEAMIREALKADADSALLLKPLAGKSLRIQITDLPLNILLLPAAETIYVRIHTDQPAEAVLSGTIQQWFGFIKHHQNPLALQEQGLKVQGDLGTLHAYQRLAQQLNIQWESLLAYFAGDSTAYALSRPLKKIGQWARNNLRSTLQDITETLQEEKRWLVPRAELEDFYNDIATLRRDIQRLAAQCP